MEQSRRTFLKTGAVLSAAALANYSTFSFAGDYRSQLGGVVAVTVTPCCSDNSLDASAMASLAGRLSQAGVNGIFLAGSTGDMPQLNLADRELLVRSVKPAIKPETKIYAGITFLTIPDIIDAAKRLADHGADAGVLMTPLSFFSYSQNEIMTYYRTVADQSPIPIIMYHHVRATTPLELETIVALADHPNIAGMKETGPSLERTFAILDRIKNKNFILLQGNEPYSVGCFNKGIHGGMFALTGVCPEWVVPLWKAAKNNDQNAYDAAAKRLLSLCEVFKIMPRSASFSYFTYTLKLMLKYRGWLDNTAVRFPGFQPDPNYPKKLTDFLKRIDFPTS